MQFDSDIALFGTGVAPLVAANHLLIQGKSVLLLNPDLDFYLEDSELPLDPFVQQLPSLEQLTKNLAKNAISILRPEFPGAIELWSNQSAPSGFQDSSAPHVHQRGRLWISSPDKTSPWQWENLEDFYVETSDAGLNPQMLDGISAARRFPGYSSHSANFRGLYLPALCDADVVRYKNGLLEYVRERLDPSRVNLAVDSVECMPEGIRFRSQNASHTAKLSEGMLVFWTPRLSGWVLGQAKKTEIAPKLPEGVRVWEQWILNSRENIDPNTVGILNGMAVWADFEGSPTNNTDRLSVLRAGPLAPLNGFQLPQGGLNCASAESFATLSYLCEAFLRWDRFSIRGMKARAIFQWKDKTPWTLLQDPRVRIVPACDGPLTDIVEATRAACDGLTEGTTT